MKGFNYKDSFVAVREFRTGRLSNELQKTCFCCNKKINNCNATLLINNYKYIPNTILHSDCFEEWKDKTDVLCDDICSAYGDWKHLNKVFGNN